MKKNKRNVFFTMLLTLVLIIAGCGSGSSEGTDGQKESGEASDELRVALSVQPANLDQPMSSTSVARDMGRLMFETLVTVDENYNVVPGLAETIEPSEDSKTFRFKLREGIKFHNGKEMTAEDVVASMYRWVDKSSVTDVIFAGATFTAEDDYTVVLELVEPTALALDTMAATNMAAAIMPKEIVESAAAEGVTEYIGTGPYKFEEWVQDQYIHFTKYEDYQSTEGEASGLAGKKEALVDNIYFDVVGDASTRLAGLQTGKYDFSYTLQFDSYAQIQNEKNIEPFLDDYGQLVMYYNEKTGISTDFKIREAVNTAVNLDEVLMATFANEDLYSVNSSYMSQEWKSGQVMREVSFITNRILKKRKKY